MDTNVDATDQKALVQIASHTIAACRRRAWLDAMQARTTRVRSVLAALRRSISASAFTSVKVNGGWHIIIGETTVLNIATRPPGHARADLEAPFLVEVHQPDLVSLEKLERLADLGHILLREPTRTT